MRSKRAPLELATQPEPATQDAAAMMLMPGAKRRDGVKRLAATERGGEN